MAKINLYQDPYFSKLLKSSGLAVEIFTDLKNYKTDHHGHDVLEMLFVTKGYLKHKTNNAISKIPAGTLLIINYGQSHNIFIKDQPASFVNMYVDLARISFENIHESLRTKLREVLPLHPIFGHKLNQIMQLQIDQQEEFENILNAIQSEQFSRQDGYTNMMRTYFNIILSIISRSAKTHGVVNPKVKGTSCHRLEELLRYIDENLEEKLDLDQLSAQVGLSKNYLCNDFKKATSKTLMQYITERRIEKAMFDLRSTDKKVINIAFSCGFGDYSHFSRCFKNIASESPRKYRLRFKTSNI